MQPVHRYKIPYKYICCAREFRYIKNREKDDFVSGKNVPEKMLLFFFRASANLFVLCYYLLDNNVYCHTDGELQVPCDNVSQM